MKKLLLRKLYSIQYFFDSLRFIKAFFSPFKSPKLHFYFGKIAVGVPYFLPRKTVKSKTKPGWLEFKSIKWFGFNYCGLGWKTKWTATDFRHEWNPVFSLVVLNRQLAITVFHAEHCHFWESWLYYEYATDKSKSVVDRVADCINGFSNTWIGHDKRGKVTTNYYNLILKDKYKYLIPKDNE